MQRILDPMIAGEVPASDDAYNDDLEYVRELGLIAPDRPVRMANPIYREVVARVLGSLTEDTVQIEPRSFVLPDGTSAGRRATQREAIEIKVWRAKRSDPLAQGLNQLDQYLTRLGLDRGTLVVFDLRPTHPDL